MGQRFNMFNALGPRFNMFPAGDPDTWGGGPVMGHDGYGVNEELTLVEEVGRSINALMYYLETDSHLFAIEELDHLMAKLGLLRNGLEVILGRHSTLRIRDLTPEQRSQFWKALEADGKE